MVFKEKKIPKHLIIQEEYEIRQRSRFPFFKVSLFVIVASSMFYFYSIGAIQG